MEEKNPGRVAVLGVLTTLAVIMGYVEHLIDIFFLFPGLKLGLANVVIVVVLYLFSFREALMISLARVVINSFLFGDTFGMLFGLAGAVLSLLAMWSVKKTTRFSVTGVSIMGGAFHNIGQILVLWAFSGTASVLMFTPFLMIAGMCMGLITGVADSLILKSLSFLKFRD